MILQPVFTLDWELVLFTESVAAWNNFSMQCFFTRWKLDGIFSHVLVAMNKRECKGEIPFPARG